MVQDKNWFTCTYACNKCHLYSAINIFKDYLIDRRDVSFILWLINKLNLTAQLVMFRNGHSFAKSDFSYSATLSNLQKNQKCIFHKPKLRIHFHIKFSLFSRRKKHSYLGRWHLPVQGTLISLRAKSRLSLQDTSIPNTTRNCLPLQALDTTVSKKIDIS